MCGIFGVYEHPKATELAYLGLEALQHRGQDAAGLASFELKDMRIRIEKGRGRVFEVFNNDTMKRLEGNTVIGHTRYPTQGEPSLRNVQPCYTQNQKGLIAIVSNGDIVNIEEQREFLLKHMKLYSDNDAEVIAGTINFHIYNQNLAIVEAIKRMFQYMEGAFSMALITEFDKRLFLVRDPRAIRPLIIGEIDGSYCFASETCSLNVVGANVIRAVRPGEILAVGPEGLETICDDFRKPPKFCVFEIIYFSRPDSQRMGKKPGYQTFQDLRKRLGRQLAIEAGVVADMISPVPKSGIPGALGFSHESGIPFDVALIESPQSRRTFLETYREAFVDGKFFTVKDTVAKKRVVLIDDSIIEAKTLKRIVQQLRDAKADEVHVRITSPPYRCPCFYGVDTGCRNKQIYAANHSIKETKKYINANSLEYLSFEGLFKAIGEPEENFCHACFSGQYPTELPDSLKEEYQERYGRPLG